jgi:hypothetical protein
MLTVAERVDLRVLRYLYENPHAPFDLVVADVHNSHMAYAWTDARMHVISMQDRNLIALDYSRIRKDGRPAATRLTMEGLAELARLEGDWCT